MRQRAISQTRFKKVNLMQSSLKSVLERAEREFGVRVAVIDGDLQTTYAQLVGRARRLAVGITSLSTISLKVARVAILDHNSARYLETYFACALAGITIVPLNSRLAVNELKQILRQADAQILITGPVFVDMGKALSLDFQLTHLEPASYESLIAFTGSETHTSNERAEISAIYYTSGTTGEPKGACLSEKGLLSGIYDALYAFAFQPVDVWLHAAPMFHLADAAAIWAVTAAGACHVVTRFDPSTFLSIVGRARITTTSIPPTLINMIASSPDAKIADMSSLRRISFGGSPISTEVYRKARQVFRCELFQAYGITETSGFVCCGMPGDELEASLTIGHPVPSIEVRIVREDGHEADIGETGELTIRGPKVMAGYWKNPVATSFAIKDNWYYSGDLGQRGPQGLYFILGRKKDMIISGGENVYAVEVENSLTSHPAVFEAAVFGVPDPQWGEAVHAVVSVRAGIPPTIDELKTWCRTLIAGYKTPKTIEITSDPLPKSGSGKIAKHLLRSSYK